MYHFTRSTQFYIELEEICVRINKSNLTQFHNQGQIIGAQRRLLRSSSSNFGKLYLLLFNSGDITRENTGKVCSHAMPRDSLFLCLKDRTSERSLTTLEMGTNCKQNLEHKASQSPCLLPMVRLYQRLAFPVKEKGKSFHRTVSSDMGHAQVCSNSFKWEQGFS